MSRIALRTAVVPVPELNLGLVADLRADRRQVEDFLERCFAPSETSSPVTRAMRYAVMGDGQRIRPILALRVARLFGAETEHTLRAAAGVEILHCASLVVDDLPCMDNELMRRGKPATHLEFGEATATLAAFSLVALAARMVLETPATDRECLQLRRFQLALLRTLDVGSLVGGQMLDLELKGGERERLRETMNDLKTAPLFQLAVEAGCVSLPKGVPSNLNGFGRQFGLAFQLTDDYMDGEISDNEADKRILYQQYDRCREALAPYGANARPTLELINYLESRIQA
jgi:geranylgeranyl pyrophosphate synthase